MVGLSTTPGEAIAVLLRPFFTFYGGKWRTALRYPPPRWEIIVEPFAGAAGYSLRYPDHQVILHDLDPKIAATWSYIISTPSDEIYALPLWDGTWETTDDLAHLPEAARWLIGWWLNKGTVQPAKRPSAWMRAGKGSPGDFWGPVIRERIAAQAESIRHWRVHQTGYQAAVDRSATWFVDPPYQGAGVHYRHGSRNLDFGHLSAWCRSRLGQVIVCENDGADWLPFTPHLAAKANESRTGGKVSLEAIWTNGEGE